MVIKLQGIANHLHNQRRAASSYIVATWGKDEIEKENEKHIKDFKSE